MRQNEDGIFYDPKTEYEKGDYVHFEFEDEEHIGTIEAPRKGYSVAFVDIPGKGGKFLSKGRFTKVTKEDNPELFV